MVSHIHPAADPAAGSQRARSRRATSEAPARGARHTTRALMRVTFREPFVDRPREPEPAWGNLGAIESPGKCAVLCWFGSARPVPRLRQPADTTDNPVVGAGTRRPSWRRWERGPRGSDHDAERGMALRPTASTARGTCHAPVVQWPHPLAGRPRSEDCIHLVPASLAPFRCRRHATCRSPRRCRTGSRSSSPSTSPTTKRAGRSRSVAFSMARRSPLRWHRRPWRPGRSWRFAMQDAAATSRLGSVRRWRSKGINARPQRRTGASAAPAPEWDEGSLQARGTQ